MKQLLQYWEKDYYTGAISFLLAIVALIVSIWRRKKDPKLKPLIVFLLAYILGQLLVLFESLTKLLSDTEKYRIFLYIDFIDTVIEFLTLLYVVKNHIISNRLKRVLIILLLLFMSWVAVYFIYYTIERNKIDNYFLQILFTIEAFFLIASCVFYYVDLFAREPKVELTNYPSFWAVTGFAFFMLCTLPFSILGLYLVAAKHKSLYDKLFTIFEVFYWILFLMIIKAYFCKPETAK